jgi:uncharacterized protein DUF4337
MSSVNEELQEHSEHAKDPLSRKAAGTMGIIAAVLAVVAVYGHITTTKELLSQQKASDQWSFYQAKALRRYQSEVAGDLFRAFNTEQAAHGVEKYAKNVERYESEAKVIEDKAHEFEAESKVMGHKALRLHLGEVFLEIAIVVCSLAILSQRKLFWHAALASGCCGVAVSLTSLLVSS